MGKTGIEEQLRKHNAEQVELIEIHLSKEKSPITYALKKQELVEQGMTEKEPERFIDTTVFDMEFYYSINNGLFLVESEAAETVLPMYDPYTGKKLEEPEE